MLHAAPRAERDHAALRAERASLSTLRRPCGRVPLEEVWPGGPDDSHIYPGRLADARRSSLTTLLDPLTFRAAETFLRGAPEQGHEVLWEALSKSVGALATFVDALMLNDRMPVFDYYVTWEPGIAGLASLVDLVNVEAEALVEVRVHHEAYEAARKPAVAVLRRLPRH